MTKQEVAQLLALAAANFPHMQERDLAPTAALWFEMLKNEEYPAAQAGLLKLLTQAKHFPTVGEVLESIASVTSTLPEPEAAWQEVLKQVRSVGYTGKPTWSHEAVGRTAMALYGSWVQLCRSLTPENMGVDRAHFLKMYGKHSAKETVPAGVQMLIGKVRDRLALPEGGRSGESEV